MVDRSMRADQRLQRREELLVMRVSRRDQQHRVIGRQRAALGSARQLQLVLRDAAVAGERRDDIDIAARRPRDT